MTIEEQVKTMTTALADKKAVDVRSYDVRGISGICDAFVVASGTAAPHLKGLAAGVVNAMRQAGVQAYRTSGDPESGWIVVDFIDTVLHVFSPEARQYYALEKLWEAAKPIA